MSVLLSRMTRVSISRGRLRSIHIDFDELNEEAAELAKRITVSFRELGL